MLKKLNKELTRKILLARLEYSSKKLVLLFETVPTEMLGTSSNVAHLFAF